MEVTPLRLDFGTGLLDAPTTQSVQLVNTGGDTLTVGPLELIGDDQLFAMGSDAHAVLVAGDELTVELTYAASEVGDHQASLVVNSDGAGAPVVELFGSTHGDLVLTPGAWDAGSVEIPCSESVDVVLENRGTDRVYIEPWQITGSGFWVNGGPSVTTALHPGESMTAIVGYQPLTEGASTGSLTVINADNSIPPMSLDAVGVYSATEIDAFTYVAPTSVPPPPAVDMLFAVDQSCSMDDNSSHLADLLTPMVDGFSDLGMDWQLGVVTLPHACFNHGILTSSTPDLHTRFAEAVLDGHDASGDSWNSEKLYAMVEDALEAAAPGRCNDGFLRPDAQLHVVFVSDEKDRSPYSWTTYLTTYANAIGVVTPPSDRLFLSLLGDLDLVCGDFSGTGQYEDGVLYTGGALLDICQIEPSFGTALAEAAVA